MHDNTWPRSNDRLIAKRIEGVAVTVINSVVDGIHNEPHMQDPDRSNWIIPIPHYLTDLLACYRAAETWRKGGDGRMYTLESAVEMATYTPAMPCVTFAEWGFSSRKTVGDTLTEAFARALLQLAERTEP